MKRENVSKNRKQNVDSFKASDCMLEVPDDFISILGIIKVQYKTGRGEPNKPVTNQCPTCETCWASASDEAKN